MDNGGLHNMNKQDIIRKLTSRKFWIAVVGFITPLLLAFGVAEATVTQVTAIIMAGADVVAYLIAEGMADSTSVKE
jgi:hypothetical protein